MPVASRDEYKAPLWDYDFCSVVSLPGYPSCGVLKEESEMSQIPVTDTIAHALMQLVDDSNNSGVYREPSHADIEFHVNQAGLAELDPKQQGAANWKGEARSRCPLRSHGFEPSGGKPVRVRLARKGARMRGIPGGVHQLRRARGD
jgi:hypothetical protein